MNTSFIIHFITRHTFDRRFFFLSESSVDGVEAEADDVEGAHNSTGDIEIVPPFLFATLAAISCSYKHIHLIHRRMEPSERVS